MSSKTNFNDFKNNIPLRDYNGNSSILLFSWVQDDYDLSGFPLTLKLLRRIELKVFINQQTVNKQFLVNTFTTLPVIKSYREDALEFTSIDIVLLTSFKLKFRMSSSSWKGASKNSKIILTIQLVLNVNGWKTENVFLIMR